MLSDKAVISHMGLLSTLTVASVTEELNFNFKIKNFEIISDYKEVAKYYRVPVYPYPSFLYMTIVQ